MQAVPRFEYFVSSIPNTQLAKAFHIAYELLNVTRLIWRFHSDVMYSRFGKNSRQYTTMSKLHNPYVLKSVLDSIVCHFFRQDTLDLLKVFPNATRAEALMGKITTLSPVDLFYSNKLIVKHLRGVYNGWTKRERPLPKKFSYANMERLHPILLRYKSCMQNIISFSKIRKYSPTLSHKLNKILRQVSRQLEYMTSLTKVYPIIKEFQQLGLPAGHTTETLAAEHTYEQVKDMLEGHPSKLNMV